MQRMMSGLASLLTLASIAVASPSQAAAYNIEHTYCFGSLAPSGTCPPNGSSEWAHLYINEADDPYEIRWTCVDEFLDPNNNGYFTGQACVYYPNENAHEYPGGTWGYPRTWNGGANTHFVSGTEYGN
jgi:hypothetical protein